MNGYQLLAQFEQQIKEALLVPNSWLPENFQDHRTDSVSLADLEKKCHSMEIGETEHQQEKREKDRRIELYRSMIDNGQEITY
ncbi:MAG: hypothetical protein EBT86_12410 [Actinobacteria bacterium]|nr:hypothetical protein [Actinomycetota bacterium]